MINTLCIATSYRNLRNFLHITELVHVKPYSVWNPLASTVGNGREFKEFSAQNLEIFMSRLHKIVIWIYKSMSISVCLEITQNVKSEQHKVHEQIHNRGNNSQGWLVNWCTFFFFFFACSWLTIKTVHTIPYRIDIHDCSCIHGDDDYNILPPSQNKCLNFILTLVQSCTKVKTLILGRRKYE
jgi:hypothetical protein